MISIPPKTLRKFDWNQVDLQSSFDFVEALAAVALEEDHALRRDVLKRLNELDSAPSLGFLRDDLRAFDALSDQQAWTEWLLLAERVFLSVEMIKSQELTNKALDEQREDLEAASATARILVEEREGLLCVHPLVADRKSDRELGNRLPWSMIKTAREFFGLDDAKANRSVFEAWLKGYLQDDDTRAISEWVCREEPWQALYRETLRTRLSMLEVVRLRGDWTFAVAQDRIELPHAKIVLRFPLPHLGEDAHVVGRLHTDGVAFDADYERVLIPPLVSYSLDRYEWGDAVTGRITTRLVTRDADPLEQASSAAHSVRRVADGFEHPRAESLCLAVAFALRSGVLRDQLEKASKLFEDGGQETENESRWATLALDIRLALGTAMDRLESDGILEELRAIDSELSNFGSAIFLIDEQEYEALIANDFIDEDTWWGTRERARRLVPRSEIAAALTKLRDQRDGTSFTGLSVVKARPDLGRVTPFLPAQRLPGLRLAAASHGTRTALRDLASTSNENFGDALDDANRFVANEPCLWLDGEVLNAVREVTETHGRAHGAELTTITRLVEPRPGRVPLLLVDDSGRGHLAELRVRHAPGHGLFKDVPQFRALAREGIGTAFEAAASVSKLGAPRYALEDHAVNVIGLDNETVDGDSLALPFAVAFASLWLQRPIPNDLAFTGRLMHRKNVWHVLPVEAIEGKVTSLALHAGGRRLRIITSSRHREAPERHGVSAEPADDLPGALSIAGVSLSDAEYSPAWGSMSSCETQLDQLIRDVKEQNLTPHEVAESEPWFVLGNKLKLLTRWIAKNGLSTVDESKVILGAVYAALAFTHAGEMELVKDLLAEAPAIEHEPSEVTILREVVRLGFAIDREDWSGGDAILERLHAALDRVLAPEKRRVNGYALGTEGRFLLHRGDTTSALEKLRQAVAAFGRPLEHERGRTQIYVAAALRRAGQLNLAEAELENARNNLTQFTKGHSEPYFRQTLIFWYYESARLLIELGRGEEALQSATAALEMARHRAFWPQLGVLRVIAWAHRLLGNMDQADQVVDHMRALEIPEAHAALAGRIIDEAAQMPISDGEAY